MASSPEKSVGIAPRAGVAESIKDRLSSELVFALVGPVGSGVSTTANLIREKLTGPFKYKCPPILRPSDVIID